MSTRTIEACVPIRMSAALTHESLRRVIAALQERSPVLAVKLHDLHIADEGEVQVPIVLESALHPERGVLTITIRAKANDTLFPTFSGDFSVVSEGRECELWLNGTYEPPFGRIGAVLDRNLLHYAAQRSLQAFLHRVSDEIDDDARMHYGRRNLYPTP